MKNTNLINVVLRGMASTLQRIDPEKINEEGQEAMREVEAALEDLKYAIVGMRIIEEMEEDERNREWAGIL
jgi:hypothetical protein